MISSSKESSKSKQKLHRCLVREREWYFKDDSRFKSMIRGENKVFLYRFVKDLRISEYHKNLPGLYHKCLYIYWNRKKNMLGRRLGIEIKENSFAPGLHIFHPGNIVVNGRAKIGEDCYLRGDNCIGNDGITPECPVIGKGVRLGWGAKVIGRVTIADDITIAAGAVVVDSFLEAGLTIGGVPARVLKGKEKNV